MLRVCGVVPPVLHMPSWCGAEASTGMTLPFCHASVYRLSQPCIVLTRFLYGFHVSLACCMRPYCYFPWLDFISSLHEVELLYTAEFIYFFFCYNGLKPVFLLFTHERHRFQLPQQRNFDIHLYFMLDCHNLGPAYWFYCMLGRIASSVTFSFKPYIQVRM
jgi:hypothetical protein